MQTRGVKIQDAKKILNSNGKQYSDEEVRLILDFMYQIGEIEYEAFMEREKKNDVTKFHAPIQYAAKICS
jgi:hypothetical protein